MTEQITDAEKAIRAGAIAAFISMGMTLIMTILAATGNVDMGVDGDWYLLIDVALIAALAVGIWFKSRIAATLMLAYFVLSKIIQFSGGEFDGIIIALAFLYFYVRAVIGSFRYHSLVKKGLNQADVF